MCYTLLLLHLLLILFFLGESLLSTVLCLSSKNLVYVSFVGHPSKFRTLAIFVIIDLKLYIKYINLQ
jgi:hypothetical protein